LAVIDVLYKNKYASKETDTEPDTDPESDDEQCNEDDGVTIFQEEHKVEFTESFGPRIKKVQKLVHAFKNSCLKSDLLKKYTKELLGKELCMIADCPTRWNSLCAMLERFVELKASLQKCLSVLKKELQIKVSEEDFKTIQEIANALKPVKLGVEALCRKNASLLTANAVMKFIIQKLKQQENLISSSLLSSLLGRFRERYVPKLAGVVQWLHDPGSKPDKNFSVPLETLNKELLGFATKLQGNNHEIENDEDNATLESDSEEESLEAELEKCIENICSPQKRQTGAASSSVAALIRKEIALHKQQGSRGKILENILKCAFNNSTYFGRVRESFFRIFSNMFEV